MGTWARVYEREVRGASEAARAALAHAPPERADDLLDEVSACTTSVTVYRYEAAIVVLLTVHVHGRRWPLTVGCHPPIIP